MKKEFTILLICVFLTLSSNSQNFEGGIILGISTSQVGGDNLAGFRKAGILAGVFTSRMISPFLSAKIEMNFIMKGSNNPNMTNGNHKDSNKPDISSYYLELPFLVQYHQNEKLKIEGGVLFGYLINGHYNDVIGKIPYNKKPFKNYDIGLLAGLNYKYSENISLNTRLSNSILAIGSEDDFNLNTYNSKGKYNTVLSFAIHYNL